MLKNRRCCLLTLLFLLGGVVSVDAIDTGCLCGGWQADFSLLYWRPSAPEFTIATTVTGTGPGTSSAGYALQADYDLGYRVGLRHDIERSCWQVGAAVTWLHTRDSQLVTRPPGMQPLMFGPFGTPLLSASASNRTRYLTADLEIGHPLATCRWLSVSGFGGVRYTGIEQCWSAEEEVETPPGTGHYSICSRFHGAGPRFGLDLRWCVCSGWGVVARLGSSLLFATRAANFSSSGLPNQPEIGHLSNLNNLTWQLDGKFGLQYCRAWRCLGKMILEVGVALDHVLEGATAIVSSQIGPQVRTPAFAVGGPYGRIAWAF